jgi:hypothetical protein
MLRRFVFLTGSLALLTTSRHAATYPPSSGGGQGHPDRPLAVATRGSVPAFAGPLDTAEAIRALDAFLDAYQEHPAIRLDVSLADSTAGRLGPDDMNRYYLNLAYGEHPSRMGSELLILLDEGPAAGVLVTRTSRPPRLVACLRYIQVSGPNRGIMSYAMAPLPAARCR